MPDYELGKPTGVTIAPFPDGREAVYVADTHYHRVMVYDVNAGDGEHAEPLASFGEFGYEQGQFIYTTDVAVLETTNGVERVFVSEYGGNDRITIFSSAFEPLGTIGTPGNGPGLEFMRPQSIVVDHDNRELIVADSSNHRVGRLTLDGELIAWIGAGHSGTGAGEFSFPHGVELLSPGVVAVSEFGNNRLQVIDVQRGVSLAILGEPGSGVGQLKTPWACTMRGGELFLLDSGNDRIQIIPAPNGRSRG